MQQLLATACTQQTAPARGCTRLPLVPSHNIQSTSFKVFARRHEGFQTLGKITQITCNGALSASDCHKTGRILPELSRGRNPALARNASRCYSIHINIPALQRRLITDARPGLLKLLSEVWTNTNHSQYSVNACSFCAANHKPNVNKLQ